METKACISEDPRPVIRGFAQCSLHSFVSPNEQGFGVVGDVVPSQRSIHIFMQRYP